MSALPKRPSHRPIAAVLRANARRMRHTPTSAERMLWYALRGHRLRGLMFRRQVPIAGFIADFACHQKKLVIEVDGATHGTDGELRRDAVRTAALEAEGYRILRFWNDDIYRDLPGVLERVIASAQGQDA